MSKAIVFYVFPRDEETITCAYPHQAMAMKLWNISSSDIRYGHGLWMVPKAVRRIMSEQYLYVESFAQGQLGDRRFQHCKSVAALCVTLAQAHGADLQKAYVAGMLHDICKEWSRERLHSYLNALDPQRLKEPAAIWHGYGGAYYVAQAFGIHDRDIFQINPRWQGLSMLRISLILRAAMTVLKPSPCVSVIWRRDIKK